MSPAWTRKRERPNQLPRPRTVVDLSLSSPRHMARGGLPQSGALCGARCAAATRGWLWHPRIHTPGRARRITPGVIIECPARTRPVCAEWGNFLLVPRQHRMPPLTAPKAGARIVVTHGARGRRSRCYVHRVRADTQRTGDGTVRLTPAQPHKGVQFPWIEGELSHTTGGRGRPFGPVTRHECLLPEPSAAGSLAAPRSDISLRGARGDEQCPRTSAKCLAGGRREDIRDIRRPVQTPSRTVGVRRVGQRWCGDVR